MPLFRVSPIAGIAYLPIYFRCRLRGEGQGWLREVCGVSLRFCLNGWWARERSRREEREREMEKDRKGVRVRMGY
jgi:hypothetical protein